MAIDISIETFRQVISKITVPANKAQPGNTINGLAYSHTELLQDLREASSAFYTAYQNVDLPILEDLERNVDSLLVTAAENGLINERDADLIGFMVSRLTDQKLGR